IGIDLVDDAPRIGPFVFDVRETGGEHDVVDADIVALLDRHPFVLDAEIDVIADVVARQFLQRLKAQLFLGPTEMALVPKIHVIEPERDPAEACLSKEDLQFGKALEYPSQHQLGNARSRSETKIA